VIESEKKRGRRRGREREREGGRERECAFVRESVCESETDKER